MGESLKPGNEARKVAIVTGAAVRIPSQASGNINAILVTAGYLSPGSEKLLPGI
jgi:hypothetical protein